MASTGKRRGANDDIQVETASPNLEHLDDVDLHDKALNVGAQEATAQEHSIGFIQGFKTYKRAAFWSIREPPDPEPFMFIISLRLTCFQSSR